MKGFMRPGLEEIDPGVPAGRRPPIRLDCNESPFDLPPSLKCLAAQKICDLSLNRYPDAAALAVREQIARNLGVKPGEIVLGNGLDEVILMIVLAFGAGRRVIIPVPGFSAYKTSAILAGATVVEVPLAPWLDLDVQKVLEEAAREPGLVFICSPHNPTGRSVRPEIVERLLRETGSLVVVDEAYWEFAGTSCLSMLQEYDRLIVLRTFSKAFSLAGVRLGYAVLNEDAASWLTRAKMPYNVSSLSLAVAGVVLDDPVHVRETVSRVVAERERVFSALLASPHVVPLPSCANFILFTTSCPAGDVYERLRERGIAVRSFPRAPFLSNYLRVSIGNPSDDDAFLDALNRLLVNEEQRAMMRGGFHA
ncbi:MAG: histidinol-phosphate transaminase [Bacillota bacterium]